MPFILYTVMDLKTEPLVVQPGSLTKGREGADAEKDYTGKQS